MLHTLLLLLTFLLIFVRGYLYFTNNQLLASLLDLALAPIYAVACIRDLRFAYVSIMAFLPASSIFYLATGAIPFDLSLLIGILSIGLMTHELRQRPLGKPLAWVMVFYGLLIAYLLVNLAVNFVVDARQLYEQVKVLYYTGTALATGYLVWKIYSPTHAMYLLRALEIAFFAYMLTSCVGYLFPLQTYTWQLGTEFHFKSLFRYPGMSSSNYVSHTLLMMMAMHYCVSRRVGIRIPALVYLSLLAILGVVSQSRGYAGAAIVLIATVAALEMIRPPTQLRRLHRVPSYRWVGIAAVIAIVAISIPNLDLLQRLAMQAIDRVTFSDRSVVNISYRISEWDEVLRYFSDGYGNVLRGNLAFTDAIRPHNVILSMFFLFGVPLAVLGTTALLALWLRLPVLGFVAVGAQVEILFFSGLYDFLFLMFVVILSSTQNWLSDSPAFISVDRSSPGVPGGASA